MVVVFGSVNLDLVARVARIPAPGETIAGRTLATLPGGKGANQALAARAAGAAVAMYGAVGADTFAAAALANLRAAGVELDGVATFAGATGVALINVADDGENAITVIPGANALARADAVPDGRLSRGVTLLMQLEVPVAQVASLAARARARGARVVLNAAPAVPLPDALLSAIDVLVVNESEAAAYASRDHRRRHRAGPQRSAQPRPRHDSPAAPAEVPRYRPQAGLIGNSSPSPGGGGSLAPGDAQHRP